MYISIIYAWERKWIRPVSKWPSPRNLTSWNSPFSFISEGSFGGRRSRARSLIRPGFAIMISVKMHKKKWKHPQCLTFLEKSTTLSIVVKKNLAGKTLNPPSDDRKVSKEKGRRERFLKSQRQSYHSSVKIDAHPSAHSKGSRRVKDAFSGQINILN